jgi:hypothetical protein
LQPGRTGQQKHSSLGQRLDIQLACEPHAQHNAGPAVSTRGLAGRPHSTVWLAGHLHAAKQRPRRPSPLYAVLVAVEEVLLRTVFNLGQDFSNLIFHYIISSLPGCAYWPWGCSGGSRAAGSTRPVRPGWAAAACHDAAAGPSSHPPWPACRAGHPTARGLWRLRAHWPCRAAPAKRGARWTRRREPGCRGGTCVRRVGQACCSMVRPHRRHPNVSPFPYILPITTYKIRLIWVVVIVVTVVVVIHEVKYRESADSWSHQALRQHEASQRS